MTFEGWTEDRANHPPMAWEEEGPSGATQATGTKASTSKGHSRTSPLCEPEGGLVSPIGWSGWIRVSPPQLETSKAEELL